MSKIASTRNSLSNSRAYTTRATSPREFNRIEWMVLVVNGVVSAYQARVALGLGKSQIYKLINQYRKRGPASLCNQHRGRSSNRAFSPKLRARVIKLIQNRYADYGPTLIAEMLEECHNIKLAIETVRQWMMKAGLWCLNKAKRRRIRRPRKRAACRGQLVQIDGSTYEWFEGRADACSLMLHIDDGTGELLYGEFFPTETGNAYLATTKACVAAHGRPLVFLTDHHSGVGEHYKTALADLGIAHSFAHTPQSKGRVERMNRTLQDRLVKALRRANVSSIRDGNQFLSAYFAKFNKKFAKIPAQKVDKFRSLRAQDDLDFIFTKRFERKLSRQLTFSLNGRTYVIHEVANEHLLSGKRIEIRFEANGKMTAWYGGKNLAFGNTDQ